jgi:hypothetical protein
MANALERGIYAVSLFGSEQFIHFVHFCSRIDAA